MNFSEVFKTAVARRLFPHSAIRKEDLCGAVGIHGMTLRSWLRGENAPSGPMVAAVIDFFARHGDHHFLVELYPSAATPLVQRARKADAALKFVESFKAFMAEGEAA